MSVAKKLLVGATALVAIAPGLTACSGDEDALVIYNAQHEELIEAVAKAFEEKTDINVELRNGKDLELANQLVQEGSASPADVFLTENSPGMTLVAEDGLFKPLPQKILDQIPAGFRPADGSWTGFAARSTVFVYNTEQLTEAELPASIMDLADPEWQGRISFSPTGADFQAIVSAVLATEGEEATQEWLAGLKANGTVLDGNNVVLQQVDDGEIEGGIIYHYYWYRDQEENGENSDDSQLHYFGNQDPGAFVSVSGAGILKGGKHDADAEKFMEFLVSPEGQQVIADSYALEYTLNPEVDLGRDVKPLSELQPPTVDIATLNSPQVVELMQEAGFL
ncbi:iron ABC transporter substrate-binding protein [Nocardioides speluncae]|uniref:iron ABC transporter substrate-binding protein n=1 Tax=Nocardioides speluncae TaxID=2670337 RepID=UPI000D68EC58|nr:iron ABC transporter substrate-binding protein [Nocardioides speluncae]